MAQVSIASTKRRRSTSCNQILGSIQGDEKTKEKQEVGLEESLGAKKKGNPAPVSSWNHGNGVEE